jgi:hypothetical protein
MTYLEEIQRRIDLKKQLIILTEEEIAELEIKLLEATNG